MEINLRKGGSQMDKKHSIDLIGGSVTFRRMGRVHEYKNPNKSLVQRLSVLVNEETRAGNGTLHVFHDGWSYVPNA
jgi:hypothetical protein